VATAVVAVVESNGGVENATVGVLHPPTRRRRSPSLAKTQTTPAPLIAGTVGAPQTAPQTTNRPRRLRQRRRQRRQL